MSQDAAPLLMAALRILRERLPRGWTVEQVQSSAQPADAFLEIGTQTGAAASGLVLVEIKPRFGPADVERLLGGLTRRLRSASGASPILLLSEFLSPRTRELLAREDISYLDLTGNVRLVMQQPALFIDASGSDRRPRQRDGSSPAGLSGAKAWNIIRFLAEVEPPYGVMDIEAATGISRGWVSRVLDGLADQGFIQREPRRPVESVDWPALLRARGQSVELFRANTTRTYVARQGARAALEVVQDSGLADDVVVTGSHAAVRIAPVAAPSLLSLYLAPGDPDVSFADVAEALGLLPADAGGDVALMKPSTGAPVEAVRRVDGLAMVNLPQLVVDSLGGVGRMPAEGEAVLAWMRENEAAWRFPTLSAYVRRRP